TGSRAAHGAANGPESLQVVVIHRIVLQREADPLQPMMRLRWASSVDAQQTGNKKGRTTKSPTVPDRSQERRFSTDAIQQATESHQQPDSQDAPARGS